MKFWSRYWSRLWEPTQKEEQPDETPELASGRERLPPATARRILHQPEVPRGGSLHQHAARIMQNVLGNRRLARLDPGRPLPPAFRARLEASLGIDLSSVRLHHDEAAAQALNARAFTVGDQIVLGQAADLADPELVGHEAAHIAQAQGHGLREGISQPGGATEQEARLAAQAIQTGQPATVAQTGGPVPAIQRQEQKGETPAPADPMVRRESVRMMLLLHYQLQGGQGPFKLTPDLQNELKRLIPELSSADIARLWTPEPAGPMEAFQRLVDGGYLPTVQGRAAA